MEPHTTLSIEIRLSVPDLVSQLWRKSDFSPNCETKSGTDLEGLHGFEAATFCQGGL